MQGCGISTANALELLQSCTCPSISFSSTDSWNLFTNDDDVIKRKHFLSYCPFVRGIHRWPVDYHKGQWRGALLFSLICTCTNGWTNNRDAGDLIRHCAHYDVTVMTLFSGLGTFTMLPMYQQSNHEGFNSLRPSDAYMRQWTNHHWSR